MSSQPRNTTRLVGEDEERPQGGRTNTEASQQKLGPPLSRSDDPAVTTPSRPIVGSHEDTFIDSEELARRWNVPASWVRDQVRRRAKDPLPHVNFGKYVRFRWGSPELQDWLARRIVLGNNRRVGRVQ